jgi:hypothetical protein
VSDDPLSEYGGEVPELGRRKYIEYTDEIALEICERVSGGENIATICESANIPDRRTVFRWLRTRQDFERAYCLATQIRAETFADELIALADAPLQSREETELRKLQIDTRKWTAARLLPRYADRQLLGITTPQRLSEDISPVESARRMLFAIGLADHALDRSAQTRASEVLQPAAEEVREQPEPEPVTAEPEDAVVVSESDEPVDFGRGLSEARQRNEQFASWRRGPELPKVVRRARFGLFSKR